MLSLRFAVISTVMVFAIACGDSSSSSPTSPSPPPVSSPTPTPEPTGSATSVVIPVGAEFLGNRAFVPGELSITAGTTVTWMNTDSTSHTSTSDTPGWDSGIVPPGGQFSFGFQTAGTFSYHCAIHPGMVGTVIVR